MTEWTFYARVLPERVPLTFSLPLAKVELPFTGTNVSLETAIFTSQVVVRLVHESGPESNVGELRNAVEQYLRTSLDVIGYEMGFGLDVDMISAQRLGSHDWHVFGINIPALAARSRFGRGGLPAELLAAIGSEPKAQMALSDFREAMKIPAQTGFYCYRCVETIMQWFRVEGETKASAWSKLRGDLKIDEDVLKMLQGFAASARHGEYAGMSDADRLQCFTYTDEIIFRFLRRLVKKFGSDHPEEFTSLILL